MYHRRPTLHSPPLNVSRVRPGRRSRPASCAYRRHRPRTRCLRADRLRSPNRPSFRLFIDTYISSSIPRHEHRYLQASTIRPFTAFTPFFRQTTFTPADTMDAGGIILRASSKFIVHIAMERGGGGKLPGGYGEETFSFSLSLRTTLPVRAGAQHSHPCSSFFIVLIARDERFSRESVVGYARLRPCRANE